jgi:hypothetical protein
VLEGRLANGSARELPIFDNDHHDILENDKTGNPGIGLEMNKVE